MMIRFRCFLTVAGFLTAVACFMFLAAAPVLAQEDEEVPLVVAILDFRFDGVSIADEAAERMNQYLVSRVTAEGAYLVVPRDQVARALVAQKVKAQNPCYGSCSVTIGGAVGANKVLHPVMMKVGGECALILDLLDLQTETMERSVEVPKLPCTELGLREGISKGARQISSRVAIPVGGTAGAAVIGGGTVKEGVNIDRGESIVNVPTDATGLLFVDTNPAGANIQINGDPVGTAPYQAPLMVGRYVIVAELNSYYHVARQEVNLTTAGNTVVMELPQAFGALSVTSTPSGAEVLLDDRPVGRTPYVDDRVLSGDHVIEVRQLLYKPERRPIKVVDGQKTAEVFDLAPDFGGIRIVSDPPGAAVSIDGKDTGRRTPVNVTQIKTGMHVVTFELDGYGRRVDNVSVIAGQTVSIDAKLEPKYGHLTVMTTGRQDGKPCRGSVAVDRLEMGQTPWKGQVLAVGHQVRVDCGGRAVTQDVVIQHNENKVLTIEVDNPSAGATVRPPAVTPVAPADKPVAGTPPQKKEDKYAKFDARRTRASFQARLSGGLDLNRATNGVGGLIQIGVGTGRWFDIHTGVGFPSYSWVTDFEVNIWPYGRFIPTLAARVSLGFHPLHNVHGFDFTVGVEAWATSWLAFYLKIGVGYAWNLTHDTSGVYVPGWLGVEFRY